MVERLEIYAAGSGRFGDWRIIITFGARKSVSRLWWARSEVLLG
jgi:hypothetical protein